MMKTILNLSVFISLVLSTSFLHAGGNTGYYNVRSIQVSTNRDDGIIVEVRLEGYQFTGCSGGGVGPSLILQISDPSSVMQSTALSAALSVFQVAKAQNLTVNVSWGACINTSAIIDSVTLGPYP